VETKLKKHPAFKSTNLTVITKTHCAIVRMRVALRIAAAKQKISKKLLDAALPLATAQAVFLMEDEEVGADEEFVFPSNGEVLPFYVIT